MALASLRGGCSCGRNKYIIHLPHDATEHAHVFFEDSDSQRRAHANLLSAYLRIPLPWLQSTTYAFFTDETPSEIRRVYIPPSEQSSKRHFCGFCGTPLTRWTEEPDTVGTEQAGFISVTLGSLSNSDLRALEEFDLVPEEVLASVKEKTAVEPSGGETAANVDESERKITKPWYQSLLGGASLGTGKMRTTRGAAESEDGTSRVEWEVTEWTAGDDDDDDSETVTPVRQKRKLDESLGKEDSAMDGLH